MAPPRSLDGLQSQLLAEATSRPGDLRPVLPGEAAEHAIRPLGPGQVQCPDREFLGVGEVEKRRQDGTIGHVPHADDLGDRHRLDRRDRVVGRPFGVDEGQGAVRGAEVDADDVSRHGVASGASVA